MRRPEDEQYRAKSKQIPLGCPSLRESPYEIGLRGSWHAILHQSSRRMFAVGNRKPTRHTFRRA